MKNDLVCPVYNVNRLKILLYNSITYINTEMMTSESLDEKIKILKEEIGFTDEEFEKLNIVEECLEEE